MAEHHRLIVVTSRLAYDGISNTPATVTTYSWGSKNADGTYTNRSFQSGNETDYTFAALTSGSVDGAPGRCQMYQTKTQVYQGLAGQGGTLLRTVTTAYSSNSVSDFLVPTDVTTTLDTGLSSTTHSSYQMGLNTTAASNNVSYTGNVTHSYVYDYTSAGTTGSLLAETDITYLWTDGTKQAYLTANLFDQVESVTTSSPNSLTSTATYYYDENNGSPTGLAYGNLTTISHILNTSAIPVTTRTVYNANGMPIELIDSNSNVTHIDSYGCNGLAPSSVTVAYQSTSAMPETSTQIQDCNTGKITSVTDPNGVLTLYDWADDSLGRLTKIERAHGISGAESWTQIIYPSMTQVSVFQDQNTLQDGVVQTGTTFDGLGRVITNQLSNGAVVATTYNNDGRIATTTAPYFTDASGSSATTSYSYDALGRPIAQILPDGNSRTMCYDNVSVSSLQTNCSPMFNANSGGVTWVDSTDEAGNHHQQVSNGLGQLIKVVEPNPANSAALLYETDYGYDLYGNLHSVNQLGNVANGDTPRQRFFIYDSLSRLIEAYNPETGYICYGTTPGGAAATGTNCTSRYDPNGNLLSKTDARGVVTSYTYDALNRVLGITSSDGSINNQYVYDDILDQGNYGIGRLAGETSIVTSPVSVVNGPSVVGGASYFYDPLGRPTWKGINSRTSVLNGPVSFYAYYDLAGDVTGLYYPDGNYVQQRWNGAQQLLSITSPNTGVTYLSSATYTPSGAIRTQTFGNGVTETYTYNNRLQECEHSVSALIGQSAQTVYDKQYLFGSANSVGDLCASTASNNGDIMMVSDALNPATMSRAYSYDALNRLTSAYRADGGINYSYSIDSFGNMAQVNNGTGAHPNVSFTGNNQLQVAVSGYSYDLAGNLVSTGNSTVGGHSFSYDASGRVTLVDGGQTQANFYDPEGNRIYKLTEAGGYTSEYEYWGGLPLAELDGNPSDISIEGVVGLGGSLPFTDYIYANGQRIASVPSYVDSYLTVSGNAGAGGYQQWYDTHAESGPQIASLGWGVPYVIRTGDKIVWRQWQSSTAKGGLMIQTTTDSGSPVTQVLADEDGNPSNADTISGQWHNRVVALDSLAGAQLMLIGVGLGTGTTGTGAFADFADMVLISPWNGGVLQIYVGQASPSMTAVNSNMPGGSAGVSSSPTSTGSNTAATHYYVSDNVGTAQLEFAGGGWPIWQGEFAPYGQEIDTNVTANNFTFASSEKDPESGLNYFSARFYGPVLGRFTSPDQLGGSLSNPQSLNRYAYALNNPLMFVDPTGLKPCLGVGGLGDDGTGEDDGSEGITIHPCPNATQDPPGTEMDASGQSGNSDYTLASQDSWGGPSAAGDGMANNPMAQALFHGGGQPYWGGANSMATAGVVFGLGAPAAGFFAPEIAAAGATALSYTSSAASSTANAIGLFGSPAGRIFWSGLGYFGAQAAAELEQGVTLESTWFGTALEDVQQLFNLPYATIKPLWDWASAAFARGAQGPVTMFADPFRVGQTWQNIESVILNAQGNPITTVPF